MQQMILDGYKSLMAALSTLPGEIAACANDLADAKRILANTRKLLDEIEMVAMAQAEGSNETKRKADAFARLAGDGSYQRLLKAQREEALVVDRLTIESELLSKQYGAVCFQAQLHAALTQYLANAKAPVVEPEHPVTNDYGDVIFPGPQAGTGFANDPVKYATKGNGNDWVTGADAATFGTAKASLSQFGL